VNKPRRLLLSPRAAADLEEIADYIARDNPPRAVSFLLELEENAAPQPRLQNFFPFGATSHPAFGWPCMAAISYSSAT
jgi:ParE toxin of type II toxin-antitoxin system, parDE